MKSRPSIATEAIHTGGRYQGDTGAVTPPVYLTSTFASGNRDGFDYTRSGNPNFRNLEDTLSHLERGRFATVFSSGVAAITAIVSSLAAGDLVLAEENIYGSTYRLFERVFRKFGLRVEYLDFSDPTAGEEVVARCPKLVWIESPTNPLLKIIDIAATARWCRKAEATLVVDNTFASPVIQRPLEFGADLSLSSTTKYVNGHSDALGGVVVTNSSEWHERMTFAQKALGLNPSPFDTWLIQRGAKTLPARMRQHSENALAVARFLEGSGAARWVRYPFLHSHPQYELARRQMSAGSGIVTAELRLSLEGTHRFLRSLKLFTLAESLGGVESLVCHPASMTHASIPREVREALGMTDSLVRFSVGIEGDEDLIADIEQALEATG